jgi:ABC-type amino acid transport substrate-binding protein
VGINPLFKPFSFPEIKGEQVRQVGVDIDIAKLLAKELDVELKIIPSPDGNYSELIPMLLRDEIDIIIAAMSRIFKRTRLVEFSDSYYDTGTGIMLNKVRCHELGICDVRDYHELKRELKFMRNESRLIIAATSGKAPRFSIKQFFPNVPEDHIVEFETNKKAAEATAETTSKPNSVKSPHIMVHDLIFLNTWVRENPDKAFLKLFVFPKPYRSDSYGFAIKKGNQSFLNMLNIFISDKLHGEGQFNEFMEKYNKHR